MKLFSEYGLVSVGLARDGNGPDAKSKGFAFIEVATKADAEKLVQEMNGFFCEEGRRISVRPVRRIMLLILLITN